ncbi:uncharacterized protein LOC144154936 [Haemaphysalis longicornis]
MRSEVTEKTGGVRPLQRSPSVTQPTTKPELPQDPFATPPSGPFRGCQASNWDHIGFLHDQAEPSLIDLSFDTSTPVPQKLRPGDVSDGEKMRTPSPPRDASGSSSYLWHQLNTTGKSLLTDVEQPWLIGSSFSSAPSTPQEPQRSGTASSPLLISWQDATDPDAASQGESTQ